MDTKAWLKSLYAILAFCCIIYFIVSFLYWVGFYSSLFKQHPLILIGFVSLAHIIGVPCIWWALRGHGKFFLPFIIINAIFIVGVVVMMILIYNETMGLRAYVEWRTSPLHHLLLLTYFAVAMACEILAVNHMNKISTISREGSI